MEKKIIVLSALSLSILFTSCWSRVSNIPEQKTPLKQAPSADKRTINKEYTKNDMELGDLSLYSNEDIIRKYETVGLMLKETNRIITDEEFSRLAFDDTRVTDIGRNFRKIRDEITRRGSEIVPLLVEFLKQEVPKQRPKNECALVPSFTRDIIELLVSIRDPSPATLLVDILAGFHGTAMVPERWAALYGLECLTYCSFRKESLYESSFHYDAVMHTSAIEIDKDLLDKAIELYRVWLKEEGNNPKQWLQLAIKRARQIFDTDDLKEIYCVAQFLRPSDRYRSSPAVFERDDDPNKTLARLAQIGSEFEKRQDGYFWRGKHISSVMYNDWTILITRYGPRARPYSRVLIRFIEENNLDDWGAFERLGYVGGKEVMTFFFKCLPKLTNNSLQRCQMGIDRWAGRLFKTDNERIKWWEENKNKTEEDWLREGLPIVAMQSDAGETLSHLIIESMLPDLPPPYRSRFSSELDVNKVIVPVSRVEWLKQNKDKLKYDAQLGGFKLQKN